MAGDSVFTRRSWRNGGCELGPLLARCWVFCPPCARSFAQCVGTTSDHVHLNPLFLTHEWNALHSAVHPLPSASVFSVVVFCVCFFWSTFTCHTRIATRKPDDHPLPRSFVALLSVFLTDVLLSVWWCTGGWVVGRLVQVAVAEPRAISARHCKPQCPPVRGGNGVSHVNVPCLHLFEVGNGMSHVNIPCLHLFDVGTV